jgi:hypothetical protein
VITISAVFLTPLSDRPSECIDDLFDVGLKKLDGIEAKRAVVGQVHLVARVAGVEAVTDEGRLSRHGAAFSESKSVSERLSRLDECPGEQAERDGRGECP